jgi:hypothetical protein
MQWIGEGAQFALRHREAVGGRTLCLVLAPRSAKRSVARALPWGSSISAFGTRAAASTSDTTPTARGDSHQPHLQLHHPAQLACQNPCRQQPGLQCLRSLRKYLRRAGCHYATGKSSPPRAAHFVAEEQRCVLWRSTSPPIAFCFVSFLVSFPLAPFFGVARKFFDGGICGRRAECGGRAWSTGACEGMLTENAFLVLRGRA